MVCESYWGDRKSTWERACSYCCAFVFSCNYNDWFPIHLIHRRLFHPTQGRDGMPGEPVSKPFLQLYSECICCGFAVPSGFTCIDVFRLCRIMHTFKFYFDSQLENKVNTLIRRCFNVEYPLRFILFFFRFDAILEGNLLYWSRKP